MDVVRRFDAPDFNNFSKLKIYLCPHAHGNNDAVARF